MQVVGPNQELEGPSWITIGVFDGVHRGHQELIRRVISRARASAASAVVVTFDPNPLEVLRPDVAPARIATLEHRLELISQLGVDSCLVYPFTHEASQMSAEDFARGVIFRQLHAVGVVIGENFRFGRRATGDVSLLQQLGEPIGVQVEGLGLMSADSEAISSSRIRGLIAAGEVTQANRLLGRRHCVEGEVVAGHKRGRDLGYPTANLRLPPRTAVPADGVYAGLTRLEGRVVRAAISIGTNPTFDGDTRTVEAFLLDVDEDLYGRWLRLEFDHRLRETIRFSTVSELLEQMAIDVELARAMPLP